MSVLNEYVKTIVGVSLLGGIISVTAPSGSNTKTFRFVSGIFILLCLILPLKDSIEGLRGFNWNFNPGSMEYTFSDTENYTYELIENEMKSNLNACVKQVTGESALDISVIVQGDNSKVEISAVTITLKEAYVHKAQALKEYVFSRFGITPTVIT